MTDFDKAIDEAKAAILPYESWERLAGESSLAFAAFCAFRDYGPERSIRKACQFRFAELATEFRQAETPQVNSTPETKLIERRYRVWRNWCTQFRWRERAADFDRYTEKLKQEEFRKTIEAQGEMHRKVTGKMLEVVREKLERMNPDDLSQGTVTDGYRRRLGRNGRSGNLR